MSLLAVRKSFVVDYSGRYDLVVDATAFADNGANKFIRSGQRWLDRTFEISKSQGQWFSTLAIGDWYALVPFCRYITSVWMSDATNGKWRLTHRDFAQFREDAQTIPTGIDKGQPQIYTVGSLRTIIEVANTIIIDKYGTVTFSTTGDHYDYTGLIWLTPTDIVRTLEVHGRFYQPALINDNDTNYWSENEPDVLAMAGARAIELSLRNIQGVNDWTNAIKEQLVGLEFDFAAEESEEVHYLEG